MPGVPFEILLGGFGLGRKDIKILISGIHMVYHVLFVGTIWLSTPKCITTWEPFFRHLW